MQSGLPFDTFQRLERDIPVRVLDGNTALFYRVLELMMAANYGYFVPAI
jgi:hypothetical protein